MREPYFQTELIKLYLGDCLEAMREMPDKAFDLAIVDPFYGKTLKQGGYTQNNMGSRPFKHDYHLSLWDLDAPSLEYFNYLARVSKNQIIWGANHLSDRLPFPSPCWIVWDKKRKEQHWADGELAWGSFDTALKIFEYAWDGFRQGDMKNKEIRIHPTQKPVALYRWLLTNYAKPGDTILDTHLGSGSIAIACHDLGFHLTGYEIDEEYLSGAVKRIERHLRQPKLFAPRPEPMKQESLLTACNRSVDC